MAERGLSATAQGALAWTVDRIDGRARAVVAVALVLAAAALGYAVSHLRIDTSTDDMISAEVPFRQNNLAFLRAFPEFRNPIVAVIEGTTPEQGEQAAAALALALRADAPHFAAVEADASDPFFAEHGLLYLGVDELAELSDRLAAAQPLLAALAEDPSLRGLAAFVELAVGQQGAGNALPAELDRLLGSMAGPIAAQMAGRPGELSWRQALDGADHKMARGPQLVLVEPRSDPASFGGAAAAIEALRAHARALGIDAAHGLSLNLTGEATLSQEELQSVRAGATLAALLSTAAVTLLLVWGLQSLRLIAATLITLALGLVLTAGFAALTIGRLNLISVTFAVLFVGLGVDFGIHLALRYREALGADGSHRAALHAAVAGVAGPLSLSALCAAFGFLAFAPTAYRGLAELGVISAGGMAIAWLASLTLLPALLDLMPLGRDHRALPRPRLLPGIQRHPRLVVALAALGALASIAAVPEVRFDANPLNLNDPKSESVRTYRALAADPATSPEFADVLADSLAAADRTAAELDRLPSVDHALTLSSFVPEAQDAKLELIDSLALYIGPILEPGAAAAPPDAAARRAALERLIASAKAAAAAGPGAGQLSAALGTFAGARPSDAALADLERRLTGTLPDLLARLRQALAAGPVTLADLPDSLRARWLGPDGRARVLVRPAMPLTDDARLEEFAQAVLSVAPHATGMPIIVTQAGEVVIGAFQEASWLALGTDHRAAGPGAAPAARHPARAGAARAGSAADRGDRGAARPEPEFRQCDRAAAAARARRQRRHPRRHALARGAVLRDGCRDQHPAGGPVQRADHDRLVRLARGLGAPRPREHGAAADHRDPVEPGQHARGPAERACPAQPAEREQSAMKVAMLAAGVGLRLDPTGQAPPKALLRIGGRSLLERHLEILAHFGLDDITLVVGHQAGAIAEALSAIGAGGRVQTVFNPDYRSSSLLSLRMLRGVFTAGEPVLYMDADVLYDRRLLARLLAAEEPDCLLIDAAAADSEESPQGLRRGWAGSSGSTSGSRSRATTIGRNGWDLPASGRRAPPASPPPSRATWRAAGPE